MSTFTADSYLNPSPGIEGFYTTVWSPVGGSTPPSPYSQTSASLPYPVGANLSGGTTGTAYLETITAQGGTSPYTFAVTGGSLPAGLTLSSAEVISGTPSATGTSTFTITATDVSGNSGSQSFSLAIATPTGSSASNYSFVA
jgi:large repetitive protein